MNLLEALRMNCRQATYLHEQKKEGKLGGAERFGLWFHIQYCRFCRLFFRQIEQLEGASKHLEETDVPLSPAAKETIRKSLDEEMRNG